MTNIQSKSTKHFTKLLLLLSFLLVTQFSFGQRANCQKFKEGKFIYPDIEDVYVIRKGKSQKSYNKDKLEIVSKVKWTTNCRYELKIKKINIPGALKKGDLLVCTIVKSEGDKIFVDVVFYAKGSKEGKKMPRSTIMVLQKD